MALTFGNKSPVAPAWRTLLGPDRVARSKYRDARYVMTIEPIHSSRKGAITPVATSLGAAWEDRLRRRTADKIERRDRPGGLIREYYRAAA